MFAVRSPAKTSMHAGTVGVINPFPLAYWIEGQYEEAKFHQSLAARW